MFPQTRIIIFEKLHGWKLRFICLIVLSSDTYTHLAIHENIYAGVIQIGCKFKYYVGGIMLETDIIFTQKNTEQRHIHTKEDRTRLLNPDIAYTQNNVCHKNIERHTAHIIVSWPNTKQWVIVHTSDLMMIIRQSMYILSIITKEMGKLIKHTAPHIV